MGTIFYIMGKSSTGKDTIYERLLAGEDLKLSPFVVYTTRPRRDNEMEGKQYHFVTEERMRDMQRAGQVIELRHYDTVHGIWYYFTADSEQIDLERQNYLMLGTLESWQKMKQYYGGERVVPIYIEVEDGERLARALRRERKQQIPRYEEMCRRFLADQKDFSEEKIEAAGIRRRFFNNGALEDCIKEVSQYIRLLCSE